MIWEIEETSATIMLAIIGFFWLIIFTITLYNRFFSKQDFKSELFEILEKRKPPLTPQQARTASLVVLVAGPLIAVLAHVFLFQYLHVVALSYIAVLYLTVGFSWSFLDSRTHYRVANTWNGFLVLTIMLLSIIIFFVTDEGDPLLSYAIVLFLLGGAVVAVVLGVTALHNFKRWREGEFKEDNAAKNEVEAAAKEVAIRKQNIRMSTVTQFLIGTLALLLLMASLLCFFRGLTFWISLLGGGSFLLISLPLFYIAGKGEIPFTAPTNTIDA